MGTARAQASGPGGWNLAAQPDVNMPQSHGTEVLQQWDQASLEHSTLVLADASGCPAGEHLVFLNVLLCMISCGMKNAL